MAELEKVIKGIEQCLICGIAEYKCEGCPYILDASCITSIKCDALELLKEQEKEIKALRLLVEWAEECDFGFDQFPDEYERYKEEIEDMDYIEGMIHVAKRTLEDNGVFKDGEQ